MLLSAAIVGKRRGLVLATLCMLAACTPRDPAPLPSQVLAEDGTRTWYRGNLHAHSLWSDGNDLPDAVAGWYRGQGYHFLALSEHDTLQDGERWVDLARLPTGLDDPARVQRHVPGSEALRSEDGRRLARLHRHDELAARHDAPGRFLLMPGEEISDSVGPLSIHLNAINLPAVVAPARLHEANATIEADIDAVSRLAPDALGGVLVQLNHPNLMHSVTAEHLMRLRGTPFFELHNAHPLSNNAGDGLRPSTERLWDIALAWRLEVLGLPPLYATASDDSHQYHPGADSPPGRAWIMVLADALAPERLFEAMRGGQFYASTGVRLSRVIATPRRLEVEVTAEPGLDYRIEFIGTRSGFDARNTPATSATGRPLYASRRHSPDIGRVFARHTGTRAVYRFDDDDLYVRARITASRRHPSPSQPLQYEQAWVQPQVGPAGHVARRPHLALPEPPAAHLHLGVSRRFQPMSIEEADSLQQHPATHLACALDLLEGGRGHHGGEFRRGDNARLAGWLLDRAAAAPVDWMAVVLHGPSGRYVGEGAPTRPRPDVARVYGHDALEASGYGLELELRDVAPGDYRIHLHGYRGGRGGLCDSGRDLRVR